MAGIKGPDTSIRQRVELATWFSTLGYGARLLLPVFRNPRSWRVLDASMAVFMLVLCMLLLLRPLG